MAEAESTGQDFSALLNQEYWKALCPGLHVADRASVGNLQTIGLDEESAAAIRNLLVREGYIHAPQVEWGIDFTKLSDAVSNLVGKRIPPPFAYIYDEFWIVFYKLHGVFQTLLGPSYKVLPDFWVWHVDPKTAESGWQPHRDKGWLALFEDGSPKALTVWLPLTEATPLNGCMYIVPADRDPTYGTENDKEWKFEFSDIRALPANPGDLFIWNQAVLHWGSHSSPRAPHPRISMAFEFQRGDIDPFNAPMIEPLTFLSFEQRLALVCKQILQYRHMYPLDPELEAFARKTIGA
ncbi:MAG: phytanoyl-CoA dioxygenase family protein [Oceanibaculum nanhaiense]|jgi:hypothetical protein|uniref:phytanoyl-CoA dioxygenase family protein n=1 Tax=Oceanibaculum nanhaiense TaxID=1909734 RepID=UPI0032EDD777